MQATTIAPSDVTEKSDTNAESLPIGPGNLLPRDVQVRLSKLRPFAMVSTLLFDFGLIAAVVLACEYLQNPAFYLFAVVVIGARQSGIASIALHDGVHRLLSRNRKLNDLLGRSLSVLVCTPIVMGFDAYRDHHFDHHRGTNTEEDPDHEFIEKVYSVPRWMAALYILAPLTGVLFLLAIGNYVFQNVRRHPLAALAVFSTTLLLAVGWYADLALAVLLVKYWFVPLGTWGVFASQIRALAEHYPEDEFQRDAETPRVFRTRDILNSWFDQAFLVTRGLNFHLTHHLCPQVPFYNLREMQTELAKSPIYREYAHVTQGYHNFIIEYFFQRPQNIGHSS